jgi:hypothetical protein
MPDSQLDWDARHCQFSNQIRRFFWPTRLRPDSVLQNKFISLWILHKSYRPVRVDEFGYLNLLILISKDQDILIWISNVKAENPSARRIVARVFFAILFFKTILSNFECFMKVVVLYMLMNLVFWIAWFRYQKSKIFPFEYVVWK